VDPEPPAISERVTVGLLDGRAGGGPDVGQEERRLDVAGKLAQVALVPGRLNAVKHRRCVDTCVVPADTEAIPVGRLHAQAGVKALVYEGVVGPVEQFL
jgi:hypothetical protein